ncbi:MAG: hypothetical protein QW733_03915 [Desulfurococcaceae archaeon]
MAKKRGNTLKELEALGNLLSSEEYEQALELFLKDPESAKPGSLGFLVLGPSGYGKTSIFWSVIEKLKKEGRNVVVAEVRLSNYSDIANFVGERVPTPYGYMIQYYPDTLLDIEREIMKLLREKGMTAELEEFKAKLREFEERYKEGDVHALVERSYFLREYCQKKNIEVVYLFEEITLMPDKMNALFFGFIDHREVDVFAFPYGHVFAPGNLAKELGAAFAFFTAPFMLRFMKVGYGPTLQYYLKYGEETGKYHPAAVAYLNLNPHLFGEYEIDENDEKKEVNPRYLESVSKMLRTFGNNVELLKKFIKGVWPEDVAESFLNFYVNNYLEVYNRIMSKAAEFKRTGVISPIDTGEDLDSISVSLATLIAHINSRLRALEDRPSKEDIALLSVYLASFIHMNGKLLLLQEKEGKNLAIASEFLSTFIQSYLSGIGTRHKLLSPETYEAMGNYIEKLKGKGRLSIEDIEGFLSLPGVFESIKHDGIHSPPIMAFIKLMNEANAIERTPAIEKGIKEMRKGLEEVYSMYNKGPKR